MAGRFWLQDNSVLVLLKSTGTLSLNIKSIKGLKSYFPIFYNPCFSNSPQSSQISISISLACFSKHDPTLSAGISQLLTKWMGNLENDASRGHRESVIGWPFQSYSPPLYYLHVSVFKNTVTLALTWQPLPFLLQGFSFFWCQDLSPPCRCFNKFPSPLFYRRTIIAFCASLCITNVIGVTNHK